MSNTTGSQLADAPDWLPVIDALPRPRFDLLSEWLEPRQFPPAELHALWTEAALHWLGRLANALGPRYRIDRADGFLLLSPRGPGDAQRTLGVAQRSLQQVKATLPGIAADEGYGPHVVMIFDPIDDYYTYISHFDSDGEFATSGGTFLDGDGYGHIAVPLGEMDSLWQTLVHELGHACLRHLPLPLWLEEGLVQFVTTEATGSDAFRLDHEMRERHQSYWSDVGLDAFWRGESFSFADDEGQELSYHLADWLTRLILLEHTAKAKPFVLAAAYEDAGDAAAVEHMGMPIGKLVERALGPGPWQPTPVSND